MAIRQDLSTKTTQTQGQRMAASQVQNLIAAQGQDLDQQVMQALLLNPALTLEGDLLDAEDDFRDQIDPEISDDEEGWNEDFDRKPDEYETGERETDFGGEDWQTADIITAIQREVLQEWGDNPERLDEIWEQIDYYSTNGELPPDADEDLSALVSSLEQLAPDTDRTIQPPTFEVLVIGDQVQATLLSTLADRIRLSSKSGESNKQKNDAEGFLKQIQLRRQNLESMAEILLGEVQADFFRQPDLKTALLYLVPVKEINELGIFSPIKMDKSYKSYIGNLLVSCSLGVFPLHLFWPSVAELLRMWVRFAFEEDLAGIRVQQEWIKKQISEIIERYYEGDNRRAFMTALQECKETDIKNARKAIKKMESS